jgi:hypothetical protein
VSILFRNEQDAAGQTGKPLQRATAADQFVAVGDFQFAGEIRRQFSQQSIEASEFIRAFT